MNSFRSALRSSVVILSLVVVYAPQAFAAAPPVTTVLADGSLMFTQQVTLNTAGKEIKSITAAKDAGGHFTAAELVAGSEFKKLNGVAVHGFVFRVNGVSVGIPDAFIQKQANGTYVLAQVKTTTRDKTGKISKIVSEGYTSSGTFVADIQEFNPHTDDPARGRKTLESRVEYFDASKTFPISKNITAYKYYPANKGGGIQKIVHTAYQIGSGKDPSREVVTTRTFGTAGEQLTMTIVESTRGKVIKTTETREYDYSVASKPLLTFSKEAVTVNGAFQSNIETYYFYREDRSLAEKYTLTLNAKGQGTLLIGEFFENGGKVFETSLVYVYNGTVFVSNYTAFTYPEGAKTLIFKDELIERFDAKNRLTSEIYTVFTIVDGKATTRAESRKDTLYTYNAKGRLTNISKKEYVLENGVPNLTKLQSQVDTLLQYDSLGNIINVEIKDFKISEAGAIVPNKLNFYYTSVLTFSGNSAKIEDKIYLLDAAGNIVSGKFISQATFNYAFSSAFGAYLLTGAAEVSRSFDEAFRVTREITRSFNKFGDLTSIDTLDLDAAGKVTDRLTITNDYDSEGFLKSSETKRFVIENGQATLKLSYKDVLNITYARNGAKVDSKTFFIKQDGTADATKTAYSSVDDYKLENNGYILIKSTVTQTLYTKTGLATDEEVQVFTPEDGLASDRLTKNEYNANGLLQTSRTYDYGLFEKGVLTANYQNVKSITMKTYFYSGTAPAGYVEIFANRENPSLSTMKTYTYQSGRYVLTSTEAYTPTDSDLFGSVPVPSFLGYDPNSQAGRSAPDTSKKTEVVGGTTLSELVSKRAAHEQAAHKDPRQVPQMEKDEARRQIPAVN